MTLGWQECRFGLSWRWRAIGTSHKNEEGRLEGIVTSGVLPLSLSLITLSQLAPTNTSACERGLRHDRRPHADGRGQADLLRNDQECKVLLRLIGGAMPVGC